MMGASQRGCIRQCSLGRIDFLCGLAESPSAQALHVNSSPHHPAPTPPTHQQVHHRLLLQLRVQARQQAARQLRHQAAVHLLGAARQRHIAQRLLGSRDLVRHMLSSRVYCTAGRKTTRCPAAGDGTLMCAHLRCHGTHGCRLAVRDEHLHEMGEKHTQQMIDAHLGKQASGRCCSLCTPPTAPLARPLPPPSPGAGPPGGWTGW